LWLWIAVALLVCLLSACSSSGRVVNHSFGFDVANAVPAVEVLDYHYGTFDSPGTRPAKWQLNSGRVFYFQGITGAMPVAEFLYVKWRIKGTGEVFEDTVDLRQRLPRDMKDKKVAFYIVGAQLYVYVVDPDSLPPGAQQVIPEGAPIKNLPSTYHKVYKIIYPDSPPSQQ